LKEILNNPFMVTTVCCLINVAIKRLKKRGMTCEDIEAGLNGMPVETKVEICDFVIDNSRGLKETKKQVRQLFEELQEGETKA